MKDLRYQMPDLRCQAIRLVSLFCCSIALLAACSPAQEPETGTPELETFSTPFLMVLGIAQDAGYPQAACQKDCCRLVHEGKAEKRMVSCISLVDPQSKRFWLFDATPDFREQIQKVEDILPGATLAGVFLTHAHIGHYTGLMHLGREVMGADKIPVYAMPRMQSFLENNGPWSQLVALENIAIQALKTDSAVILANHIQITPLLVPHRDEFSETVAYSIKGREKSALFIPDIDKWHLWERSITEEIQKHDIAFLDGSFFENGEIPGRDMSLIPHPFITESMQTFQALPAPERSKVHFIHFNHTNPVLQQYSKARQQVFDQGFQLAEEGWQIGM